MKNDARLLLNKKKNWKRNSNKNNQDVWKSRSPVDARKILNRKRYQKPNQSNFGSYMRTKTATELIASQIQKQISASKVPSKRIELSRDGNIIVTAKPKNNPQVLQKKEVVPKFNIGPFSRNRSFEENMECQPSTSMDDLEHTAIEDLIDLESLPHSYVASKSLLNANLSRNSAIGQVLDKKYTMVADQLSHYSAPVNNRVYVSNLHPTVSRQDVMELFGDIGVIRGIEMVMPGSAVIEFFNEGDAAKACEIYHNRLLDGLPMKCYLQSGSTPQRSAIAQRLGNRSESNYLRAQATASPTIPAAFNSRSRLGNRSESSFHHTQATSSPVIPTAFNSRSRYNPRNVQFTVKLT